MTLKLSNLNINNKSLFWVIALLLSSLFFIWPGDAPFINDEALLIHNAMTANSKQEFARQGLMGTAGVFYGPLPTWFYQCCLFATKNLIAISLIKNVFTLAIVFFALIKIGQELNYSPIFILIIFTSPYLLMFNRALWDNCLVIPLSVLLFLVYTKFEKNPRLYKLYLCFLLFVCMIYIHLVTVLVIIPFILAILVLEKRWLKENVFPVVLGAVVAILLVVPYFIEIVGRIQFKGSAKDPVLDALMNSVLGMKYFSFWGWGEYYLPEMYTNQFIFPHELTFFLVILTWLSFVFFGMGFYTSIRELSNKHKRNISLTLEDKLAVFCVLTVIVNIIFFTMVRHQHHPQYLVGAWFAYYFFMWKYFSAHVRRKRHQIIFGIYGVAMLLMITGLITYIHTHGGNRGKCYGATLKNQMDVAQKIVQHAPQRVLVNVNNYKFFPHSLQTLVQLAQYDKKELVNSNSNSKQVIVIEYMETGQGSSGWIAAKVIDIVK